MTVSNPELVSVLVLILAGLVLLQAIATAIALVRIERRLREITVHTGRLSKALASALSQVNVTLESVKSLPTFIRAFDESLNSLTGKLYQGLMKADSKFSEGLGSSYRRVDEMNRRIEYGLASFVRVTGRVQKNLRVPGRNLSSLVHGVMAGIRAFKAGKGNPTRPFHDEESFI